MLLVVVRRRRWWCLGRHRGRLARAALVGGACFGSLRTVEDLEQVFDPTGFNSDWTPGEVERVVMALPDLQLPFDAANVASASEALGQLVFEVRSADSTSALLGSLDCVLRKGTQSNWRGKQARMFRKFSCVANRQLPAGPWSHVNCQLRLPRPRQSRPAPVEPSVALAGPHKINQLLRCCCRQRSCSETAAEEPLLLFFAVTIATLSYTGTRLVLAEGKTERRWCKVREGGAVQVFDRRWMQLLAS